MPRKPAIDPQLAQAIRHMQPRQALYELIKREMRLRGRWRVAPRGKPFRPGFDAR